ncbi:hypothetical protein DH2020_047973 [Rehmannia glutinosa]|uniref:Protein PHLOEM PROTEIN 2-LIKE A9-like n=1 Tax=Rehmannia glutinosa TaxID=99300 RepID=A0ABR0U835_REHGL
MAANNSSHHVGNSSLEFKVADDKREMEIPAKDLNIVWGKDPRYWKVPEDNKSAAELNQVYWLEVTGCVDKTRGDKIYEVGFHVSLTPDAFGWGDVPLYLMVKRGKDGKFVWKKFFMDHHTDDQGRCYITGKSTQAQNMGAQDSDVSKLYFGLYEVWSGKWKGGLKIHHAVIRELPST